MIVLNTIWKVTRTNFYTFVLDKKSKKSKKKSPTAVVGTDAESIFQIVDQTDFSENDIEVQNHRQTVFQKFLASYHILF